MKSTEPSGKLWLVGAAAVIVLLAGIGGHMKGEVDGTAARRLRQSSSAVGGPFDTVNFVDKKPGPLDPKRFQKRLWEIWKTAPAGMFDPEARALTWRVLAEMSSPEIDAFLRSLPPGSERSGETSEMLRCIISAWILRDGPAALAYLGTCDSARVSLTRMTTNQAAMSWVQDQPDAAFAWMRDGALTPIQKERVANIRLNALMVLLESDPDRAFQELNTMHGKDVSEQLRLWSGLNGKDPDMRKRLLDCAAATGNPEDLVTVRISLASSLAATDPEAAMSFIETLQATGEELSDLEATVTVGKAGKDPEAAYTAWLERNGDATQIPASIRYGIGAWMSKDAGATISWLDALPADGQRDIVYENSVPTLAGLQHFEEAAKFTNAIDSPTLRADAMNALHTRWLLANRSKAEAWERGLSPEDRGLLRK